MRILFVCNTPFQVITALNIYCNKFRNERVTVVLNDYFNGSERVAKELQSLDLFERVYCIHTIDMIRNGSNIIKYSILSPSKLRENFDVLQEYQFDMMFFNNFDILSAIIFERIIECNPDMIPCRFEEGYSSYFNNYDQQKSCYVFEKLERLRGRKSLSKSVSQFWYYVPEFAKYKHNKSDDLRTIPMLRKDDTYLIEILNKAFSVGQIVDSYTTKFIFFEDAFAYNNERINDVEVVKMIADTVKTENLSIKLHPRSNSNRFAEIGLSSNKNVGVPWEIFQLNSNFDGKVFLAVASGSVLASKVYFDDDVKIVYLFKCVSKRPRHVTKEFENHLRKVMEQYGGDNVFIPQNTEELKRILLNIQGELE